MSAEIIMVLTILAAVIVLLITEWAPLEVLALLVMGLLAITGIVSPKEALAGFSNPAVVTIWAVFILSGGLTRTGIANILGRQLLRVTGKRDSTLILIIMVLSGVLSAFMNNVAVAALMLPVVMDIARKTKRSPSILLMPLAYGSLLGGLTTMIGTPPNILVSEALGENGLEPFSLFDYSPMGLVIMVSGVLFVTFIGIRLLPDRGGTGKTDEGSDIMSQYRLQDHLFKIRIHEDSALVGRSLARSRLGAALGLNVVGIKRGGHTILAPQISEVIQVEDRLIVEGRMEQIREMNLWRQLFGETDAIRLESLFSHGMRAARLQLGPESSVENKTLLDIDFRGRFGLNVLAIERDSEQWVEDLKIKSLKSGDVLIVHGPVGNLQAIKGNADFLDPQFMTPESMPLHADLGRRLRRVLIPETSGLIGMTLSESRLGDAVDVQILYIIRKDGTALIPSAGDSFEIDDQLIVSGRPVMMSLLLMEGLDGMFIEESVNPSDPSVLEDDQVGMVEVMLSPHTSLSGKTLGQMNFRDKYGLTVLAIWRKGKAYREDLRDIPLQFGDALLLYGRWERINQLGREPDFLVLTETAQEIPKEEKAPVALAIMGAVLIPVIMNWVPIYIAVVIGAAVMVLTKCLTMEEAYRAIEWKAVFLIAGMLPLGTALDNTGAARLIAEGVVGSLGSFGPYGILFGLLAITFLATSIIPTAALVVLMVPIALSTAAGMGISPYALMMGIAMAASSSFTSPISHPANVLVMGPGGYRFVDYVKVGVPLTLLILTLLMLILPLLWPLTPAG